VQKAPAVKLIVFIGAIGGGYRGDWRVHLHAA
jgi:hypothetical protein